ncbi:MAG: hypothetical protein AB7N91_22600 [Candidatus Tectimicrobiota bacterium]
MHPHEVTCLLQLAAAGAHPAVLAQVLGRDLRTIRTVLAQAGIRPRSRMPLPADWRHGLSPAIITAIRAYVAHLRAQEQASWQQLQHTAVDRAAATYRFPTPEAYTTVLHAAQPTETPLLLAQRLRVDINRILLACAELLPMS